MSDVVIRDIPDDALAVMDQLAARMGLSRTEFIRRRLIQDARAARISVTAEDWSRFTDTYRDLGESAVMDHAWK
jgi:hypothetical protein